MKKVFIAQHPAEAHLVRGLLESRGIPALIRGESLFGARGEAPVTPDTLPSVWVADARHADEALAIIEGHTTGADSAVAHGDNTESWTCAKCGETVESQFSECWKCGTERGQRSDAD